MGVLLLPWSNIDRVHHVPRPTATSEPNGQAQKHNSQPSRGAIDKGNSNEENALAEETWIGN